MNLICRRLAHHPTQVVFCLLSVFSMGFLAFSTGRPSAARAAGIINNDFGVISLSAASFLGTPLSIAPGTIVAAFGTRLCITSASATQQPLPTKLGGTTVTVGNKTAALFYASATQVNYLVPADLPAGDAEVVISATQENGDVVVSKGIIKIGPIGPAIYTANSSGKGAPAAVVGRVKSNGDFVYDPLPPFERDPVDAGKFIAAPIEVGTETEPAFLVLYGSGMKNAKETKALISGLEIPVTAVPAPGLIGLEQINVPILPSLKGAGVVQLVLVSEGIPSNPVQINLAGIPDPAVVVSGLPTEPVIVGQTVTIKGKGFSMVPGSNVVRFGSVQTYGIASTGEELTVIVPFGAESSRIVVQTPQAEARSDKSMKVVTSISGFVQSITPASSSPLPQPGVTVRVLGSNTSVQTNSDGVFVIPNLPPITHFLEVDSERAYSNPSDPKKLMKVAVTADRDNPLTDKVSLTPATGGVGVVGLTYNGKPGNLTNDSGASLDFTSLRAQLTGAIVRQESLAQPLAESAKSVVISDKGVSMEVPVGTGVRFADGKTSGQVQLTRIEPEHLPGVSLPKGIHPTAIAQITPFGASFSPGASISFPNPAPNQFGPGEKIDLYRYDFQSGDFIKSGVGVVSQDRTKVTSEGRIVNLTSLWLIAPPSPVTVARGRVIDQQGRPVSGATVSIKGRSNQTDLNGGFNIPDIGTLGIEEIQAEAILLRPYGGVLRGISAPVKVKSAGVTDLKQIVINVSEKPSLALTPININLGLNEASERMTAALTKAAPAGGTVVSLTSSDTGVASVPAEVTIPAGSTKVPFTLVRRGPGVASIDARASIGGDSLTASAAVAIAGSAPQLTGVSPGAAPPGAKIVISGVGLKSAADRNIVRFLRNERVVAVLDPDNNEVIEDESGEPKLRIVVPRIGQGSAKIVVAVLEGSAGIISDTSNALDFTIENPSAPTPTLADVTPDEGRPRGQATIIGSGFSAVPSENQVYFRQGSIASQARVIRSTATQMVVEIPSKSIAVGKATIVARRQTANGAQGNLSNALDFRITALAGAPLAPTIASAVNPATGQAAGREGLLVRVRGRNLGENYYVPETNGAGNDEPVMTVLFFSQNNQVMGFALPIAAQGGTEITASIPSGLNQGPAVITAVSLDVETGLQSEESNSVNFTITAATLRRISEDEPNNSLKNATDVYLRTIVDGRAAKADAAEYIDTDTKVRLHDLFLLSLKEQTQIRLLLEFTQAADLDLFVYTTNNKGVIYQVGSANKRQGTSEGLSGTLPAGNYYIAVGAASGVSRYALTILDGTGAAANLEFGPLDLMIPDRFQKIE